MDFEVLKEELKAKGVKFYYEDDAVGIVCADCRETLPLIPDKSIDLVLTDPPYGVGKQNWDNKEHWVEILKSFGHWLQTQETAIVFCATRYLKETMEYILLPYRWQFIAYSNNGMIPADIGFSKYTSALIFSSKEKIYCNAQDLREWSANTTELKSINHPTPKPSPIISYLIEHFSNFDDLILDPFLGSGTTAYCAKKLGRKCIGIEINSDYCRIAVDRLRQAVLPFETEHIQQGSGESSMFSDLTKGDRIVR